MKLPFLNAKEDEDKVDPLATAIEAALVLTSKLEKLEKDLDNIRGALRRAENETLRVDAEASILRNRVNELEAAEGRRSYKISDSDSLREMLRF